MFCVDNRNSFHLSVLSAIKLCFVAQLLLFARGNEIINADLPEEVEAGTIVFYLRDLLPATLSTFPNPEFKTIDQYLKLVRPSRRSIRNIRQGAPWVVVDSRSGALRQLKRFNREELCKNAAECFIVIKIIIMSLSETSYRKVQTLHLRIQDVNDNSPAFPQPSVDVSVSETSPLNHEIDLDKQQASDPDFGENASITYSLLPPSSYFDVRKFRDRNNNFHLRLVVKKPLDYEKTKIHRLTLRARDGGSPPRSANLRVYIAVEDENDNIPVFENKRYEVNLSEDTNLNEVVAVVHATDGDGGRNGEISYFLQTNDDRSDASRLPRCPVTVNNRTGAVILRDKLNHKLHDGYKVIVEAVDKNEVNPQRGKALLVFNVKDVNDNYPEITVTFIIYSEGNIGYVSEDEKIGTFLALITASDADDGMNGDVTMSVETVIPGEDNSFGNFTEIGKFEINEDNLLVTEINFDREKRSEYDVIIKAWDKGVPSKLSSTMIKIVILDVNEEPPVFQHSDITITLPENQEVGSVVAVANAIDYDSMNEPSLRQSSTDEIEKSLNGEVIYGLTLAMIDDENVDIKNPVSISSETGKVTLVRSLDYESKQSWKFIITARDDGRPTALQSSCNLKINVKNVNDNKPTFVIPQSDESVVYASTEAGSDAFITLQALDFGLNEQTDLRYSFEILEKNDRQVAHLNNLFHLDHVTGQLSLSGDHASGTLLGRYKIKISVSDSGNPPQSTSMTLYVNVIDQPIPLHLQGVLNQQNNDDAPFNWLILIIGAGVGGLLIIVIIIIIVVIIRRKQRNKNKNELEKEKSCQPLSGNSPSDESMPLTVHSQCGAKEVHSQDEENESKYDTSSTRRSDGGKCKHCEAPHASLDRKTFIQVKSNDFHTPVKKNRSLSLDASHRLQVADRSNIYLTGNQELDPNTWDRMNDMGKQCTKLCMSLGHSDACWMPAPEINDPITPISNPVCSPWEPKIESGRKDSGCSVNSSSSNISYYRPNKSDPKRYNEVFLSGEFPHLPDVVEKPRTLALSDGGSLMSSNASSGASRQSNILLSPSAPRSRKPRSSTRSSDSRGDVLSIARHASCATNRSTKC